ncbi:MAG: hypothetical protein FWH53_10510 [Leptospirales bacterium]|nr:hypothetical protein [Leptospirales bacterium]
MKKFFLPEPVIFFNGAESDKLPDNSIQAIEKAFSDGADAVCLNIQLSKDNEVVVPSLGNEFIPLNKIFDSFPDNRFNITIIDKNIELVNKYISIVQSSKAEERIITSSIYGKNIKLIRKLIPESVTAFTLWGLLGVYALFKSGLLNLIKDFKADVFQAPEKIGLSYIANTTLIEQLHKKGIKVHVWNIKDRIQLKRVYEAGADGFMVNDIEMAKDFLDLS